MKKGGYTTFLRRVESGVDFNRTYLEYRNGFGNITSDFWLGLENLYNIAESIPYFEMRMDILFQGTWYYQLVRFYFHTTHH